MANICHPSTSLLRWTSALGSDLDTVLLIGLTEDAHVTAVRTRLGELGFPTFFFDPSEDDGVPTLRWLRPERAVLEWPDGRALSTHQVRSVFCRYALDKLTVSGELPDIERFALTERLQAALSAFRCLDSRIWMNDPWHEARADCKLYQTYTAAQLGLQTPEQIVSGSVQDIIEFAKSHPSLVIKSISDASLALIGNEFYFERPIPSSKFLAPYTKELRLETLPTLKMDDTPSLIQGKVEKVFDVRAIVVDTNVLAYALVQGDAANVDFRLNEISRVEPIELPSDVARRLVNLVSAMQLRFAACDLILDADGAFTFLEANVSGNWLFCEQDGDLRTTETVAKALVSGASGI